MPSIRPYSPLVSCPRSSFNNFSDSGLFVLSGAKDLYVPNYQTVGAIFARWLSIKMTATATFLETFFCKELLGHDTSSLLKKCVYAKMTVVFPCGLVL